jgi:guanine nucleotide-binding protein G(i) subunit alpha
MLMLCFKVMGCGQSIVTPESKEIDRQLREAAVKKHRELKLLLLGTGGSGKSTIAKQMKVIHLDGYSATEKALYTEFVFLNIFTGFKQLVRAMDELKKFPDDESLGNVLDELRAMTVHHGNVQMNERMGSDLKKLWADPVAKEVWMCSPMARAEESAVYFFENLARCCEVVYVPFFPGFFFFFFCFFFFVFCFFF